MPKPVPTSFVYSGLLAALLLGSAQSAEAGSTAHTWGLYVRTPAPNSGGYYVANVGINLGPSWRIHAGEGIYTSGGTKFANPEVGVIYRFMPQNFSPYLGASFTNIQPNRNPGISTSGIAADVGLDWLADFGLNLGVGATIPLSSLTSIGLSVYAGWYF